MMGVFKKYLVFAAAALFVYMPFHIFLSQWLSTYTGGLDFWKGAKDSFAAILTLAIVLIVLIQRKYNKLFLVILGLTVLYTWLHLILLFATDQPRDTGLLATVYNTRLFWFVLIGYGLALLWPKQFNTRKLIRLLIILSTIVCLIGLAQWLLPKDLMTHFGYSIERGVKPAFFIDDKTDLPRIMSTLRDPNSLGAFLILPITILSSTLVRSWKTNRRMFLSGLLLLHGLALLLTFSRSALLATLLALSVFFATSYREQLTRFIKRYLLVLALLFLVTIGGIVVLRDQYFVQNVVLHSDESTVLTDSNNLHVIQIQKGIDGVENQPLGNGPGTAGLVAIHNKGLLTENYFVQIAYEVGIIGLIVFLTLLYLIIRALWYSHKNIIAIYLLASFVGLVLMNMLLHTWSNEAVAASWFMLAGTALKAKS